MRRGRIENDPPGFWCRGVSAIDKQNEGLGTGWWGWRKEEVIFSSVHIELNTSGVALTVYENGLRAEA